ncbi:MAG: C4-dicarboxylate ABC transporter substrate-binding protein [Zestosphaera tikiterensis]|uniref:C4-dicarboxylate ABC transporter substrate-binding protein n=1 Tax=Zestosphaera tikiterensis TaxID=1973259 RepID=A0A2R7Y809_9CREN|nr:MAG: C4-dicarboxylate ABC transporter substrate-binding protein [Zestosphaera tikiterensis]
MLAQSKFITPILVVLIIVAGIVGYFAGSSGVTPATTTITVSGAGPGSTVTRTVTATVTSPVTVTATAATAPKAEYELHAAYLTAPSPLDTHHYFFTRFKEKVEYRSGGRIKVILHPGGELGDQDQYLELMRKGQLFIATIEVSRFATYTDKLLFFSYPGLFRSTEEAIAFGESDVALNYVNQALEPFGWKVLAITVGGARYFLSVPEKPIKSLQDFQGLKLRVMGSPVFIEAGQCLGANPQALPYSECYTLLQTKAIDAMENEVGAIISMRFYEVAPNIAMVGWAYAWHFVVVSKQLFEQLPPDLQKIVLEAAQEAAKEKNAWGFYVERIVGIQYLIQQGAKINYFDTKPIFDRLQTCFLNKYLDKIPAEVRSWLENFRKGFG